MGDELRRGGLTLFPGERIPVLGGARSVARLEVGRSGVRESVHRQRPPCTEYLHPPSTSKISGGDRRLSSITAPAPQRHALAS